MFKKILYVIGAVMAALAAEGLNRFGGLVAEFGGEDTGFYIVFLLIAIAAVVVFIVAFFKPIPELLKWLLFAGLLASSGLMLNAPNFPVTMQILLGLVVAALATLAIPGRPKVVAAVAVEPKS